MSTLTLPPLATMLVPLTMPRRKRWTVAEFHRLWQDGWFEYCRPALLDGEIIEMPNPGPAHNMSTTLADYQLKAIFGTGFVVRVQMPLVFGLWTDPIPDLAVVPGTPFDYPDNPTSALLIVEVADTSVATDLGEKASLYATANILDYWVIDLNNRQLIVHRDPQTDPTNSARLTYRQITSFDETGVVQSVAAPASSIRVVDVLPR
jgi:Uma2 family endonuclease